MSDHINNRPEDSDHRSIHLDALIELKQKLYEIHLIDKFDSMNEIFSNLRQHDKDLAETLTLIISDFNTQLNVHQNHFVHILDKIISLEEKRLLRELTRPHTSRAQDKINSASDLHTSHASHIPQITINNGNNDSNSSAKSELIDIIKENKLLFTIVVLFILILINPVAVKTTIDYIKNFNQIEQTYSSKEESNGTK